MKNKKSISNKLNLENIKIKYYEVNEQINQLKEEIKSHEEKLDKLKSERSELDKTNG